MGVYSPRACFEFYYDVDSLLPWIGTSDILPTVFISSAGTTRRMAYCAANLYFTPFLLGIIIPG